MSDNESIDSDQEDFTTSFRSKLKDLSLRKEEDDHKYKHQFKTLQKYVTELSEQNEILVQTIEELETDSNDRILLLEDKLLNNEHLLQEQKNKSSHLQTKVDIYEKQKNELQESMQMFESESSTLNEENLKNEIHINNLEYDLNQLIQLIKRARTEGKWELSHLDLKAVSIETLLHPETIVDPLPRKYTEAATENHVDDLKAQLTARDRTISKLERQLKEKTEQYHAMVDKISHSGEMVDSVKNDVYYLEKMHKVSSTEALLNTSLLHQLQEQLRLATEKEDEIMADLQLEQDHTKNLQNDYLALQDAYQLRSIELKNKEQSIEILERQLREYKEKILNESIDLDTTDVGETYRLQFEDANQKIDELHLYIEELKLDKENETNRLQLQINKQDEMIDYLRKDFEKCKEKNAGLSSTISQLKEKNNTLSTNFSQLNKELTNERSKESRLLTEETSLRKDVERKEKELKILQGQIQRLENQKNDSEAKVALRDKAIERLQIQQKEYMEEVTRRDSALHKSELKLLQIEDDKRKAEDELEKLKKTHNFCLKELEVLKKQCNQVVTDRGKLEAQIRAFQISTESEQVVLSEEVTKREELVRRLQQENFTSNEKLETIRDQVDLYSKTVEEKDEEISSLKEKIHNKELENIDLEAKVSDLRNNEERFKNKMEEYEDEAREIILKLNAAERAQEQEAHKVTLQEEQIEELSSEVESLRLEHMDLTRNLSEKKSTVELLNKDSIRMKKNIQDKEKQLQDYQEKLLRSEKNKSSLTNEFEDLKRDIADNLTSKDHKINILQEELRLSQQRYADVNEELTTTESQLESTNAKYRELLQNSEELTIRLEEVKEELQDYEMNLAVTSEKHTTSVKENALKDQSILNLQSELDAVQQEFEHTVEELTQKTDTLQTVEIQLNDIQGKYEKVTGDNDLLSKKSEENIDLINELQTTNSHLSRQVTSLTNDVEKLKDEMLTTQESHEIAVTDMNEKLATQLKKLLAKEENVSHLQLKLSAESEKTAELLTLKERESDEKESVLFRYEDLCENFEGLKKEKEDENVILTEKISILDRKLHESTLQLSQLDGAFQLAEEKLKNTEAQLFESERCNANIESSNEELQRKCKHLESTLTSKTTSCDEIERKCSEFSTKIQTQQESITIFHNELDTTTQSLKEARLRNTRCEEIIREMRDKIASKFQENDHQNQLFSQLETQHKTLQEQHDKIQNELADVEKQNQDYLDEVRNLQNELADCKHQNEKLQNDVEEVFGKLQIVDEEKRNANEELILLTSRYSDLKKTSGKENNELLNENSHLKGNLDVKTSDLNVMHQSYKAKQEEAKLLEEKLLHITDLLSTKEHELDERNEEFFSCEQTINELHQQLQQLLNEKKDLVSETSHQLSSINQLKTDFVDAKTQLKETAQQLAHYQEKSSLTERNLTATQDQLSARIAEIVKFEKLVRKIQSDCKRLQEDKNTKEVQIGELNRMYEETKNEFLDMNEKYNNLSEQYEAQKVTLLTYEKQLDESYAQTEQLSLQIENQRNLLKETDMTLEEANDRLQSADTRVKELTSEVEMLKDQKNMLIEQDKTTNNKLRDSDTSNKQLRKELETLLSKNKSCFGQISSKDAELRVLKAELHAQKKKCSHMEKQVSRSSSQIEQQLKETQQLKDSYNKAIDSRSSHEYESEKLRNELLNVKSNLDESVDQLTSKSKELASLKTELMSLRQAKSQAEQQEKGTSQDVGVKNQFSVIDSKNKKLKIELRKALEKNKSCTNELAVTSKNNGDMKTQLQKFYDQQRKHNEETTSRDEKILTLKVDLASTDERLKLKDEESERLKNEILKLNQEHHRALEQLHMTKNELDSVRVNGDKLTRESELVVENMSTWVKEQRVGNEKLAGKLNQQKQRISELEANISQIKEENERLKLQNDNYRNSLGSKKSEHERLKKQQSQCAHQNVVIHELKNRIKELEGSLENQENEKNSTVNELENRLNTNVETIQELHKQLSELNKENIRQKSLLDRQTISRKNLHAQLKSKENDIELLKEDLNRSVNERESPQENAMFRSSRLSRPDSVASLLNKDNERSYGSMASPSKEAQDKAYWIQRVGELSAQLEQSSDYWSHKVKSVT